MEGNRLPALDKLFQTMLQGMQGQHGLRLLGNGKRVDLAEKLQPILPIRLCARVGEDDVRCLTFPLGRKIFLLQIRDLVSAGENGRGEGLSWEHSPQVV